MAKIKVLIVDDSLFMRTTISKFLKEQNDKIEIVGMASNGHQGVEMAVRLQPDVITMDIEMPVMNGIEAVKQIMDKAPTQILMVSTLTQDGANATMEALSAGAIDFIGKKNAFSEQGSMKQELISKVLDIGSNSEFKNKVLRNFKLKKTQTALSSSVVSPSKSSEKQLGDLKLDILGKAKPKKVKILIIGISTGGPQTLLTLIPSLPESLPCPVIVIQHMPPHFTNSLAQRLNSISKVSVTEGKHGDKLRAGCVYVCPGGLQTEISRIGTLNISDITPEGELYSPSVNVTLASAIKVYGTEIVFVIMTGMGRDGTDSAKLLQKQGGFVIAQSPSSCVISGMPSSIIDSNLADEIRPLDSIADGICDIFGLKAV